ncbi:MAG: cation-transporting P-type ATPase [Actinobacteria bacterium]|nr:cation-transporting P-type ATPase [Actinomycetota bacterium]
MRLCQLSNEDLLRELETRAAGLSDDEAHERLEKYGANEITEAKKTPMVLRLAANFYHTFALLLWAAGILAFVAGMPQLGWAIIAVIFINALFSFWQEFQAEKAVEALKKILPARAQVMRGGDLTEILAVNLVPGDIIVLQEGDNISADARLLQESELRVNAATLTGESEPVRKMAQPVSGDGLSPSEIPNLVMAGTSVAFGSGKAVVFSTGMNTEFGKIASLTQTVKAELSPLQREVNRVALIIAGVAIAMGAVLFGVAALLTPLSLGTAAIFAIGMLVANVPEGLLPTVTLSLAMAVKRMVRRNALVKRLSGVETLGSTTVICTDKTGTLTQNEMTVRHLWMDGRLVDVGGVGYEPVGSLTQGGTSLADDDVALLEPLMRIAALCNNARLVKPADGEGRWGIVGDPTEAALLVAAGKWGYDSARETARNPRIHELPFDSRRKRMSVIHRDGLIFTVSTSGDKAGAVEVAGADSDATDASGRGSRAELREIAYVKGAPKEVLSLCSTILVAGEEREVTDEERDSIIAQNDDLARAGLRVLAMAYRQLPSDTELNPETVEREMTFVGMMAMMDPPRPEVESAIELCREAGISVKMITGDYGLTAESVARRIGLLGSEQAHIVNGSDLEAMSDDELTSVVEEPNVLFARVSPEHKMRIASALKKKGEIVAMTGDGVNDAPALKTADIGVAMGISGTDVAKEAATIILTDDNFATIVGAVEEGRVVYDNMKKFLAYIFAHATPEVIPFAAFVLFDVPLPIVVMQILAIDLGTETLPALALGVEKAEPDIMKRPPRSSKERLVNKQMLFRAWVFLGLIEAVLVMGGYFWVLYSGGWHWGETLEADNTLYLQATTMTWAGIVATQVGTAFACRTNRVSVFTVGFWSNRWLLWGVLFEVVLTVLIVYVPPLQKVFATAGLSWHQWAVLVTFAPIMFLSDELRKMFSRRFSARAATGGAE